MNWMAVAGGAVAGGAAVLAVTRRMATVPGYRESAPGGAEDGIHPARLAMREILIRAGDGGMTGGELHRDLSGRGYPVHRTTMYDWLAREAGLGLVVRHRNSFGTWWHWTGQEGRR